LELSTDAALLSALDARSKSLRATRRDRRRPDAVQKAGPRAEGAGATPSCAGEAAGRARRCSSHEGARHLPIERSTLNQIEHSGATTLTEADVDAWLERQKKSLVAGRGELPSRMAPFS
jgi:hypothetical protein